MIVVDTNVLGYLYIPAAQTEMAEQVFLKDPEWLAPRLWRSELRNVLALYLRRSLLQLEDALAIMSQAERMMTGREVEAPSFQILSLAQASGRSAYDCEFVAVAEELGAPFVTADQQLVRAFPGIATTLDDFLAT